MTHKSRPAWWDKLGSQRATYLGGEKLWSDDEDPSWSDYIWKPTSEMSRGLFERALNQVASGFQKLTPVFENLNLIMSETVKTMLLGMK